MQDLSDVRRALGREMHIRLAHQVNLLQQRVIETSVVFRTASLVELCNDFSCIYFVACDYYTTPSAIWHCSPTC